MHISKYFTVGCNYLSLPLIPASGTALMFTLLYCHLFIGTCIGQWTGEPAGLPSQYKMTLQWRHNEQDDVSNHQPHDCLLKCLFRRISKKTSKLRVTGLFEGNSPGTGEFPAQRASNAENVSIWWRHHDLLSKLGAPAVLSCLRTCFVTLIHKESITRMIYRLNELVFLFPYYTFKSHY